MQLDGRVLVPTVTRKAPDPVGLIDNDRERAVNARLS
jgi:hypothetical protein